MAQDRTDIISLKCVARSHQPSHLPTFQLTPLCWGWAGKLFTRALVAGLAVTGPLSGRSQVRRASGAQSVVGTQALDLPCLRASLAGARALGRP